MGRKIKSSDLDIIGYILIAPFFLIWGIVIFIQKIVAKNTEKQATKLNDKIKQIQLYKAVVSNVSLKEYINQIKRKKFEQNSFYNVEFSSEGVNFYTESGVFDSLHYKEIQTVKIYTSGDKKNLIVEVQYKKVVFNVSKIDNAEEFYKIISCVVEINKNTQEKTLTKALIQEKSSYEKKIETLKIKQESINGYIAKYEEDIFDLIKGFNANTFSFNGSLYASLVGNKFSDTFISNDGFYTNGYKSNDDDINEILFFVNALKKRIQETWEDKYSLDTILYIIVRNTVIKYFANLYKKNFENKNMFEFCSAIVDVKEKELTSYKMAYVCNLILEKIMPKLTDNSIAVHSIYTKTCNEIEQVLRDVKQQKKEEALFRHSETKPIEEINGELISIVEDVQQEKLTVETAITQTEEKISIDSIDKMSGDLFEKFIGDYFRSIGYDVLVTPYSGDFGVDIIIENEIVKIGVQAKRYSDTVGNSAIQEVVAGMKHYNLDKGMVITNNYFSRSARELAKDNNVVLWDRKVLIEKIKIFNEKQK